MAPAIPVIAAVGAKLAAGAAAVGKVALAAGKGIALAGKAVGGMALKGAAAVGKGAMAVGKGVATASKWVAGKAVAGAGKIAAGAQKAVAGLKIGAGKVASFGRTVKAGYQSGKALGMVTKAGVKGYRIGQWAGAHGAATLKGASTVYTMGQGAMQLKQSSDQYKDSVNRQNAYNLSLQQAEDAKNAANAAAQAEYDQRAEAYNSAMAGSSTSLNNIYSSGYSGDSILSNTLKNNKYTLI